jgi:excisionase family DNA binding protein
MLATISAAARELGCSPDHVRRMIRGGWYPYYRIGPKAIRVDPEELRNLGRLIAQSEKDRGKKEIGKETRNPDLSELPPKSVRYHNEHIS